MSELARLGCVSEGDYCVALSLVCVVPNAMQVLSLFLALLMIFKAFQQEAKGIAVKSINQATINTTVMHDIKVSRLSLA